MTEKQYPNLHIFISHSSKNNDFGFQLVKDLGYFLGNDSYIWYDSKGGLRGGDDWWSVIKKEIVHCSKFIVILSKEALNPPRWVDQEIGLAWPRHVDRRLRIIPIRCDGCKVPNRLLELRKIQIISCQTPEEYRRSFPEIIKALKLSGDPVADFIQREKHHIEAAWRSGSMDEVLQGTSFLLAYFPQAVSISIYWKRTFALLDQGKRQQAHEVFQTGLKQINDRDRHMEWIDLYIGVLLQKELLAEAIELTKQLLRWTKYPIYVNTRQKQLLDYQLQKTSVPQGPSVPISLMFSSNSSQQGLDEQQKNQLVVDQLVEPLTNVPNLHAFPPETQESGLENFFVGDGFDTSASVVSLQGMKSLSWWNAFSLFVEQKMDHPHPKEIFGDISFIVASAFDILFFIVFVLLLPTFPIIGLTVFPFAIALVIGRLTRIKAIGFLCAVFLAALWAISGCILVGDVIRREAFLFPPPNLIETLMCTIFFIAGLWGFFWHWELFKQGK